MVGEIPIFLSGLLYITTKNIEGVIHHSSEALWLSARNREDGKISDLHDSIEKLEKLRCGKHKMGMGLWSGHWVAQFFLVNGQNL